MSLIIADESGRIICFKLLAMLINRVLLFFCYEGTLLAHDQLAGHQGPAGPLQGCLPSGWPLYWMEEVVVVVLQLPRVQGEAEHLVVLLIFLRVIFQNKSGHPFSIPKVMHEK